jgi:hypothetical protein
MCHLEFGKPLVQPAIKLKIMLITLYFSQIDQEFSWAYPGKGSLFLGHFPTDMVRNLLTLSEKFNKYRVPHMFANGRSPLFL